jgi:two-component system LytT family response regulator
MIKFSALIVEDIDCNDNLTRVYLNKYYKNIDTIFTATNINDGIDLFLEHKPDIVFLNINLGLDITSFALLENYNTENCEIIFISSYEKYALKAINSNVSAYLIKPIKIEELVNAVDKIIFKITKRKLIETQLNQFTIQNSKNLSLIAIPSTNKIDMIAVDKIVNCTADGKYTVIVTSDDEEFTSSRNLGEYELLLDKSVFFRIHHKHLVNINFVKKINKKDGYYCDLSNGKNLPVSKRKQEEFNKFIRLKF